MLAGVYDVRTFDAEKSFARMFRRVSCALETDPNRDRILENIRTLEKQFGQDEERKAA